MTQLLKKAIEEISNLPDEEQDAFGVLILEELASEKSWREAFGKSQEQLATLSDEAITEFRREQTNPLALNL